MHVSLDYSLQAVYAAESTTHNGQEPMQHDCPALQSNLHLDGQSLDRQQHDHANCYEVANGPNITVMMQWLLHLCRWSGKVEFTCKDISLKVASVKAIIS